MGMVRMACEAMATRFELVLDGDDKARLRAAGEEALAEIPRLEAKLSFYRATSEISRVNAGAADGPVRVDPEVFELLASAARFYRDTGGAFDVTVGPLMRCWSFAGGTGKLPEPEALALARYRVGMQLVELDEPTRSVRFARPGVLIDLGAIGKGYAVERAALILRELGVESALLHGGTSTVHAIGRPRAGGSWKVAIEYPDTRGDGGPEHVLAVVEIENQALSVSAVRGKSFTVDDKVYGHVMDPREGWPVEGAVLAAVVSPSATETDALSTALLVLGTAKHCVLTDARRELPVLVLGHEHSGSGFSVVVRGITAKPSARLLTREVLS